MHYAGLLFAIELLASPDRASSAKYILKARETVVEMQIDFPSPYLGTPLELYTGPDPTQKTCFAAEAGLAACPRRFVGAMAVVRYSLRRANGRFPRNAAIRERVTVLDQSPGLGLRAPVSITAKVVDGTVSDVQVFGYDETPIAESDRPLEREQWKRFWRTYRQELYMDQQSEPFAIVEWRHSIGKIRLVGLRQSN